MDYSPNVLMLDGKRRPQRGVTRQDAIAVAKAAAAFLSNDGEFPMLSQGDRAGDGPFVCGPGFHVQGWTVAYEGDYDWPFRFGERLFVARQAKSAGEPVSASDEALLVLTQGVHLEAVNGWLLGVYSV